MQCFKTLVFICILLYAPTCFSADTVNLFTLGKDAASNQGDDDFIQIVFFKIPENISAPLYLRLFDPDCGGAVDERFDSWNTKTKFSFFGGNGAFSSTGLKQASLKNVNITKGNQIASKIFGIDSFTDKKWYTLVEFKAQDGENIDGFYYFKLVIQGQKGDDGNVFNVAVSLDSKSNKIPKNLKILNFAPTISLPKISGRFAELRFFIPKSTNKLYIKNYDLEHSKIWFETPFVSDYPLKSSGQGEWKQSILNIKQEQSGQMGAVIIQSYPDRHNNAIIHIQDKNMNPLPVELPIFLHKKNHRPVPVENIEFLSQCLSIIFDGSKSSDRDNHLLEYFWDFGDGHTGKGARVIHEYKKSGDYICELMVKDDSHRIADRAKKTFSLHINEPPKAEAGPDLTGAPNQVLSFSAAKSKDIDGKIQKYTWNFGDGTKSNGLLVTHSYQKPGLYKVLLRVEDDSKALCNYSTDQAQIWINARPVVDIGADKIASPLETIIFDGNNCFDSDGEIKKYIWDFGDGNQGQGNTIEHSFGKPGIYTVKLTVLDNADVSNSSNSDELTIKINDRPAAIPSVEKKAASVGEILRFNGDKSIDRDGKIIEYFWDFGDNKTGTGSTIKHSYENPGTYTITLQVTDNSKTSSDTAKSSLQVFINDPPVANAGKDQIVTVSQVNFNANASKDSDGKLIAYIWDFGDGSSGKGIQPSHFYKNPGTYTVKLIVQDDSKTSTDKTSDTLNVIVNEKPVADAGMDQIGMPGQILSFDGRSSFDPDGTITAFEWDFGDGAKSDKPAPTHVFTKPGIYTARLMVKDNRNHAQALGFDELIVKINEQPIAVAGNDIYAAPKDEIEFNAVQSYDPDGKIIEYKWEFSDNQFSAKTAKTRRSFEKSGIYTANLNIIDNSGAANAQASDSLSIHINHQPLARPGSNIHTCNQTITLDGSASIDPDGDPLSYIWDFGDSSPKQKGSQVIHTYEKGGRYPVVLLVDDGSGLSNSSHKASIDVQINQRPVADAGSHKTVCAGEIVIFNGTSSYDPEGGRLKYLWDFGDGTKGEGLNPTKVYKQGGIYPVTLIVEDDSGLTCNTDSDQFLVHAAEAPIADAGPDQIVCTDTLVRFDGSMSRDSDGLVNSFSWDFGDGTAGGGKTPSHVYELPGKYRVTLTITGDKIGDCDNTHKDEAIIHVFEAPFASFTSPKSIPVNEQVVFDASKSSLSKYKNQQSLDKNLKIVSQTWDFGDGTKGEGEKVTHVYQKFGKYFVTLTINTNSENDCNYSAVKKPIIVNAAPVAAADQQDKKAAIHQMLVFNASKSYDPDGSIIEYLWDFGDGQTSSGIEVTHQFKNPGTFPVVLKVKDNAGLSNSISDYTFSVQVNAPPKPVITMDKPAYCTGREIQFNGTKSNDPDGSIVKYLWDFGDGHSAESSIVSHTYQNPGIYSLVLTVEDDSHLINNQNKAFMKLIINQAPKAEPGPDRIVCSGEKINFDASFSNDIDDRIKNYIWDFGDGTQADGIQAVHTFKEPGNYDVLLKVIDNSGSNCNFGEKTAKIYVNSPPVAMAGPDRQIFTGGAHDAVLFDGTKSYDPDNDPLTYTWDFGDKTTDLGPKVFHYFEKPGRYNVKLMVEDNSKTPCSQAWDEAIVIVKKRK